MTQEATAEAFATALQRYERDGDLDRFVRLFADDVELRRPEQDRTFSGIAGAREFWRLYRDQFTVISSTFSRVVQHGGLGVLEWASHGQRSTGEPIHYRGVSLLNIDGEGQIRQFTTYFDTAAFVHPTSSSSS